MTPARSTTSFPLAASPGVAVPSTFEQASFGAGAVATGIFVTVPGLVVLYYLTDTLGVSAGIAGIVVVLPRLLDIVTNPIAGRLSDSTDSRWGARRPWMAGGGLLFPILFVLMFSTPLEGNAAALWVGLAFSAAGLLFAAYIVPWSALPAEIGGTRRGRTSMTSWRTAFLAVGILISGGLAPVLVDGFGGGRDGYRTMALFMAGLMVTAVLLSVTIGARRSIGGVEKQKTVGTRELFALLRVSAPLRKIILIIGLCEVAVASALTAAPYIADYVIGSESSVAVLFISLVTPLMVTMPVWSRVAARRGKVVALRAACLIFVVGSIGLASLAMIASDARLVFASLTLVVMGAGFAGTSMLPQAMLADAVASETTRSGLRQAGIVTGAANSAETIAASLAAGLYAIVLGASGFISSEDENIIQPDSAVTAIVVAVGVMSVVAIAGALVVLRRYGVVEPS